MAVIHMFPVLRLPPVPAFADIMADGLGAQLQGKGEFLLNGSLCRFQRLRIRGGEPLGFFLSVAVKTSGQQQ